ncbi:transglutaminase-like domain-containing protein, partial [Rhodoplanes roseus]|uniref:transglutaminase-like domain-containing protein n=1 Tax=Rhodoplanes roseus TaxID=29409 RepID=UPI000DABC378
LALAQGASPAAAAAFAPRPGAWRSFAVTTRLEIARPEGRMQAWVPVPSVNEAAWFRSLDSTFTSNGKATMVRDPKYGAGMVHVEWTAGEAAPFVEVTSTVATRDRAVDFSTPGRPAPLSAAERTLYTEGTDLIPVDGIVKETATKITAGAGDDVAKARAIYEWIVENTFRDARTRGCGIGDIAAMLKTGHLGGKCADLNALYVGLARAAGLPARDVYGIRLAPSAFGYKSLGAGSEVITKAQHCRAEVWLEAFGWVPVDPADVRKVMLEEPPTNLGLADPKVAAARKTLFGAWETNWLAYNVAHDLALPGAQGPRVGFLMYPQAETASQGLDCLDPDGLRYVIRAKETTAA